MKNTMQKLFFVILLFGFSCAQAEIYSWVDKDGKKHFGEQIPKEYANQGKAVEVKPTNSMTATKVNEPKKTENFSYPAMEQHRFVPPPIDDNRNAMSCQQQKVAYENSVACFAGCQSRNRSLCGCSEAKKPHCD